MAAGGVAVLTGEGVPCAGDGVGLEKLTTSPCAFLMTIAELFFAGKVKAGLGAGLFVVRPGPEADTIDGVCGWPRLEGGRSETDA